MAASLCDVCGLTVGYESPYVLVEVEGREVMDYRHLSCLALLESGLSDKYLKSLNLFFRLSYESRRDALLRYEVEVPVEPSASDWLQAIAAIRDDVKKLGLFLNDTFYEEQNGI